ncbi:TetR/AcrR family transcriptional regulator [Streptomyces sp. NPDC001508]|uniref:TetR/AcrR family transcriptional regulator n=1 Tax=Streptomyces sp. NPDC001508 TaxID=3154656 RepID=UPI00332AF838
MSAQKPTAAAPVRADAQRNAERVLAAARRAVAAHGLEVSFHEIAREAGVGVGTVYRRYPEREQLMAAVLRDILGELTATARRALEAEGAWDGFVLLFGDLTLRSAQNAGLSSSLGQHGGPAIAAQRRQLLDLARLVVERAQGAGSLRRDLTWQDVLQLTQAATASGCALGLEPAPARSRQTTLAVLLDGLRTDAR